MQYGKSVDRFFSARERFSTARFEGLEGLEPRLLLAANPVVRIKNASVLEGDAGTFNSMIFDVIRKGNVSGVTRVNYTTGLTGGVNAALQGADFLGKQGRVKFKAGQKRKTIVVPVVGNNIQQPDRSFLVTLTSAKKGRIKGKSAFGIINDDDGAGPQSTTPTVTITDVSQNEGDSGTSVFTFTVALSNPHDKTVTVDFNTSNGTAKAADNDYVPTNGTLTFAPGETTKTVNVTVNGDINAELDESFVVNLSKAVNAIIIDAAGVGKILNEDGAPSLRINDVTVVEGANGQPTKARFTVSLNGSLNEDLQVSYATADGTATAGVDYEATTGTLLFQAGQTSKTIEVTVLGDNMVEFDETFFVNLSNLRLPDADDPTDTAGVVTLTSASGRGTITNDDSAPAVSISDVSKVEGNAPATGGGGGGGGTDNQTLFTFTVSLNRPAIETSSVQYILSDGTASIGDRDYAVPLATDPNAANNTITFAEGETTKTITVAVIGDNKFEGNETFFVNLINPQRLTIADGQGIGTIINDDVAPKLSIADASATESNGAVVAMDFLVTLSEASGSPVTVNFATANNTALAGSDYTVASNSITFAPGETSKTITINIVSDTVTEPLETFFVNLSNASGATIADGQGVGTITDNDALINVNISDAQGFSNNPALNNNNEEDSSQKAFRFTITLSAASEVPVTVTYASADGTAKVANNDYIAKSGSVTFNPGETTKEVDVFVIGDTNSEENEFFVVNLTSASGANIVDSQGVANILDDDDLPFLVIEDVSRAEDAGGAVTPFTFTIRMSEPMTHVVKVNYSTSDGAVWPAHVNDLDYVATAGTVFFNPGETTKTVTVLVNNDEINEGRQTFHVNLAQAVGATIQRGTGVGYIEDDDTVVVTLSPELVQVSEGNSGTRGVSFNVSLNRISDATITVSYSTANGSATVSNLDYEQASGTIVFNPRSLVQTIGLAVVGDTLLEGDEQFFLNLTGISFSGGGDELTYSFGNSSSTIEIINDDAEPVASIENVTVTEGQDGQAMAIFNVRLSGAPGGSVSINYATFDGTATTLDNDYQAKSGVVTFGANETLKTISIPIIGDTKFEPGETFTVRLTSISGPATIGVDTATGTIANDDLSPPRMTIVDTSVPEGSGGTTKMSFLVNLDKVATETITVNYATFVGNGATATANVDFTPKNGTLIINAGQSSGVIEIDITPDTDVEGTEFFYMNLTNITGGAILEDAVAVGQILDDD